MGTALVFVGGIAFGPLAVEPIRAALAWVYEKIKSKLTGAK